MGNGVTEKKFDGNALVPFAHGVGLISDDVFEVGEFELLVTLFISFLINSPAKLIYSSMSGFSLYKNFSYRNSK